MYVPIIANGECKVLQFKIMSLYFKMRILEDVILMHTYMVVQWYSENCKSQATII